MIEKPDVCFYHFPCLDGFGAATAVHMKWPDVELRPINYGASMKEAWADFTTAGKLLFADFFPGTGAVNELIAAGNMITVLDHHKTAEADARKMLDAGEIDGLFDMGRSGAGIVWDELHGADTRPMAVNYIEDRDLWRWAYGDDSRDFHAFIASMPYDLGLWSRFMQAHDSDVDRYLSEGSAIRRKHQKDIAELIDQTLQWRTIQGHRVPVLNIPYTHGSEACHEMLQRFPDAPFAAYYVESEGQRRWGFRSEDHRVDVSAIAKAMGGGGHRNASGAEEPFPA